MKILEIYKEDGSIIVEQINEFNTSVRLDHRVTALVRHKDYNKCKMNR
ncbi:hypothetical protein H9655_21695 [Cytobacillus sp. Sa5YUA1]|uniref:Uncharacterized protein n=1 Tax=Cytobacillus stercorigallinarum TaxID=2762240 RepID=A0ABR8QVT5_9BACI|nr:hypothetical protein [Cytobacillus stercorigallinarum]MBD7939661.1 hypothetical protein [Cytobacillus stercorigallinarum]